MKEELFIVVCINSNLDTFAYIFNDLDKASDFIREDFEYEKASIEENETVNEESSYCKNDFAILTTIYNGEESTLVWSIALETDKR